MPSFPDDLNLDKNPDVSKFSTFHIIVDNFSSLDNNFLKSNGSEQPFISKTSKSDIFLFQHLSINLFPRVLLFLVVKIDAVWQVQLEFKVRNYC